jgi:hypothetical protein
MRRAPLAALLALATLALAALPTATAAAATSARDRAKAGVLVLADFPSGWTQHQQAKISDAKVIVLASKIVQCKPFVEFSKANRASPRVESPDFEQGQASVSNRVTVYPSTAKATTAMDTVSDGRLPACFEKLYTAETKVELAKSKNATRVVSISAKIAPVPGVRIGDQVVVYQGAVDVGLKNGTSQATDVGYLWVRVGDAVGSYLYLSNTDISAALQPAIVKSVKRLQDAQSAS